MAKSSQQGSAKTPQRREVGRNINPLPPNAELAAGDGFPLDKPLCKLSQHDVEMQTIQDRRARR